MVMSSKFQFIIRVLRRSASGEIHNIYSVYTLESTVCVVDFLQNPVKKVRGRCIYSVLSSVLPGFSVKNANVAIIYDKYCVYVVASIAMYLCIIIDK